MKSWKTKFKSGRNGSTLLLVIILSAAAVVLTTAVTTAVVSANAVSTDTVNSKQAYFTARSAANATMQEILNYKKDKVNNSNFYDEINSFVSDSIVGGNLVKAADSSSLTYKGTGYDSKLGYYEIKSFYVSGPKSTSPVDSETKYLRIEATGYYPCSKSNPSAAELAKCSKSTVSLLMINNQSGSTDPTLPDNPLNATNPFENVLCFTDNSNNETLSVDGASVIGNIVNSGPISINGDWFNNINAKGRVFSTSDVSITGPSLGITSIEAMGDVNLSMNAKIQCDVNAKGSFYSWNGYNYVDGNINVDGNVYLNDTIVYGNITCGGNVILNNSYVLGNVTCGGTVWNYSGHIGGTVKSYANVDKVPITYRPLSKYPAYTAPKEVPKTVVDQSNISDGGVLSNESFSGGDLTVDTGTDAEGSSVNLVVDSDLVLNNQSLKLTGTHNLFIYLQNSASITLEGNSEIGMSNENTGSKIFIIGTTQNVYVNDNSLLRAAVYLPKGKFYANWGDINLNFKKFWGFYWNQNYNYDENDLNNDKFIGSIVTKDMEVYTGGYNILFYKPDLTDTPFYNDFIVGNGGAGNNGNGYAYGKSKGNNGNGSNGNTEHKNTVDSWGFDSWVK